jgi:predicted ATPase
VVVLDDVHWLDRSSDGMVEVLLEAAGRLPVLVLASMRPGPSPDWVSAGHVVRIDLAGLSLPETGRLATEVAEAAVDSDDARRIFERTDGNPLFIAETVRASLEDGSLARRDGRVSRTEGLPDTLPLTLRAVLGARIDALPRDARDALGVAAVVGIRFRWAQIERLLAATPSARTAERLAVAGLIVAVGDDEWRFSHPLIHDAAYVGVLAAHRRTLHARIADELEGEGDPLLLNLIAIHRAASGDATRAIPLLELAADAALGIGAITEAAAFWRTAAELTPDAAVAADYRSRAAAVLSSRSASIGS